MSVEKDPGHHFGIVEYMGRILATAAQDSYATFKVILNSILGASK